MKNKSQIIEVSDKIWEFAELGLVEFKSSALLSDTLEEHGFTVERGIAGMPTAFIATFGMGHPVIGIMGEYDALPGLSQKAVPYKEPLVEGAPGHGCGHNIHGTSGMAGAIATKVAMEKNRIKGTIKFFGCPAEETYDAKVFLVRDGFFDGVDAAFAHHAFWANMAGLSSTVAINSVKFHFHGVASHAGFAPEHGRSALDALELMNVGINYMREHIVQEARIHYVTEEGGLQPNIVPPYARSWYYIRAPERDQVEQIHEWLLKIADGADLMAGTTHKVEFLTGCFNKLPNRGLSELITSNMRELGVPKYSEEELKFAKEIAKTIPREEKIGSLRMINHPHWEQMMEVLLDQSLLDAWDEGMVVPASTDVSDVSWITPTMEFVTATWVVGTTPHSWQAVAQSGMGLGHKSLIFAAKTIAGAVLDLLLKPEVLKKVHDEFEKRKRGKVYKSPLPKELKPPIQAAAERASSAQPKVGEW